MKRIGAASQINVIEVNFFRLIFPNIICPLATSLLARVILLVSSVPWIVTFEPSKNPTGIINILIPKCSFMQEWQAPHLIGQNMF